MNSFSGMSALVVWGLVVCGCAKPAEQAVKAPGSPALVQTPAPSDAGGGERAHSEGHRSDAALAQSGGFGGEAVALAPAPAPGDVLVHVRARDAKKTLTTLWAEAGLPGDVLDEAIKKGSVEMARELLRGAVDADAFGALIDWSAPMDFVVAVTGTEATKLKDAAAFSLGVTSLPRALATAKAKPTRRADGFWQLDPTDGTAPLSCGLFAASGRAPARLICGDRLRDVATLGPWLATTLASRDVPGGELHGDVRLRGLLDKVGPELTMKAKAVPLLAGAAKIGIPAFDNALMEAASALGDEAGYLVSDLDSFEVDAGLDPAAGVSVAVKANFAGATSWTVQRLLDGPTGAPEIVARAPMASSSAAYGYGGDPAAFEGVFRVLRGLAEGKLEELKFATAADRTAIAGLIRLATKKYVPTMSAHGRFDGGATDPTDIQSLVTTGVGWYVTGIEDESKSSAAWLSDLVKVYNRPALQTWAKAELKDYAKYLPTLKLVPAPAALGPGALDVELKVSNIENPMAALGVLGGGRKANWKAAPGSVSVHLLLMADGKRTFLGLGGDRDKLAALMAKSKGQVAGPGTLATVAELDAFRRESHRSGMFFTVKGSLASLDMLKPYLALAPSSMSAPVAKFFAAMTQLPHGGTTPILLTSDATRGPKPTVSLRFSVPRHAVDDLGYLVKVVVDEVKNHLLTAPVTSPALP